MNAELAGETDPSSAILASRMKSRRIKHRLSGSRTRNATQAQTVLKQFTQGCAGSVKPRLGISDGPIHHLCDLGVLVALDIVKYDDKLLEGAKLPKSMFQVKAIE
jgi:hypothetical protein